MRKVKISAVQFSLKPIKNFSEFEEQVVVRVRQAKGSDFVVFPELFTTELLTTFPDVKNFTKNDIKRTSEFTDQYFDLFTRLAKQNGQYLIAGSHLKKEGTKYYNTCHLFGPDGGLFEHKKTHIFPAEGEWDTAEGDTLEVLELKKAKIGISICYEAEIPECARILTLKGTEIIFCPSFTFSEAGFWRVRHCCQARCIENQIYMVHCCTVGDAGILDLAGWGKSSILSPCDTPWSSNGVIAEAETNKEVVITSEVDLDELYVNRETGAATTFKDRTRRSELYKELYGS
jgi:predicted amidohydrolase